LRLKSFFNRAGVTLQKFNKNWALTQMLSHQLQLKAPVLKIDAWDIVPFLYISA